MFLSNIKRRESAELFLKMACYVAMSEGDFSDLSLAINWQGMSDSELDDFYIKFIDAGFSEIERNKLKVLTYDIKSGMGSDDRIDDLDSLLWSIKREIKMSSDKFIESIKEDKDLNKIIMSSMVEFGADLSSISDNLIKASLLSIPESRGLVLKSMMMSLSFKEASSIAGILRARRNPGEANPAIENLTLTQKKTMIFELIGMGNTDQDMTGFERAMVESACDVLGVEKDFIEDAEDAIKSIMSSTSEALELINE